MRWILTVVLLVATVGLRAETPADFEKLFAAQARQENPGFVGFSAEQGQRFYASTHGKEWSCASCHGRLPTERGQHVTTGKIIAPLAPTVNAERFTRPDQVEKWFKRNCNEVLGRLCTAQEKGNFLAYLLTLR